MQLPVYLDYAASTPVDPRVAEEMMLHLTASGNFGNPASRSHIYGWRAEEAVENARSDVAELIGADPREIVWTSGATESNNLAIKGVVEAMRSRRVGKVIHVITSSVEHKAVLDTCSAVAKDGVTVTYLKPNRDGTVDCSAVESAMTQDTVLVSVMMVNNEVGSINPIAEIGALCRARGVIFHTDAAQAVGKEAIDVAALSVDLMSISAHKFYGPKGVGALYARRCNEVVVAAQIHGGGHERKMRSGTLATHQIVGLGTAARIAKQERSEEQSRLKGLKDRFLNGLQAVPGIGVNGSLEHSSPGIVNLQFEGADGETLLMALRELAISSGSACTSASVEPSYVLTAMGVTPELAQSSLRFSFGRYTSVGEVDFAVKTIAGVLASLSQIANEA